MPDAPHTTPPSDEDGRAQRTDPRRIVVVGGVAGGMSFAARARRLDESAAITVLERGDHVSFANCGLPYHVSGEIEDEASLLVQTPQSLRAALNITVHVGHEVVAIDPDRRTVTASTAHGEAEFSYDDLVLAPGAAALRPDIPGVDLPQVQTLRTVAEATRLRAVVDAVGDGRRAVVLGGGFIGVEVAEALRMRGIDVELVQSGPHVLSPLDAELAHLVQAELRGAGIRVRTHCTATRIDPAAQGVVVHLTDGDAVPADVVVVASGVTPQSQLAQQAGATLENGAILVDGFGRTSVPRIWAVGDAVAHPDPLGGRSRVVPLAGPANRDGRLLADAMLGDGQVVARPRPIAVGTAIVRVCGFTAALTGASRRALDAAGTAYETIHLHANDHAGYFPGATPIHLVVHFAAASSPAPGRILGAQAVGAAGVDKRIDVIATAMRAGLGIGDLIDLDLCYAPPYGSAKDPVTMAGLVGQNVLDGVTRHWQAWELDEVRRAALILDVRRPDEWERGHLPGALLVPHTEVRARLDEIRAAAKGRPIRVHCASGVRSYLAHRILTAAGLDSATLSGGMQTLLALHGDGILE
ncbi:FAD-dependent oxidoreductase [Microbacterium sp.]|uniref:FAD-dependent oxidoreductase n=1 Tax=Microbacterium sp. TaxID=51671 RepID=UPI0039E4EBD6